MSLSFTTHRSGRSPMMRETVN